MWIMYTWRSQQADCIITWIKTPPEQHGDHNRQIAESRGSKHHQSSMEITTGRLHNHVDQNTTRAAWRSQQADCIITWIKTPPEQHGDHNRQIAESRGSKHHQSNMEITTGRLQNHVDQNTTRAAWRSQQADCIITWIKTPPEQHGDHSRQIAESRGSKHHQSSMEITTGRLQNHVDQNTTRAAWRSQQADCIITWIKTPPEQHGDHNRQIA